MSTYFKGAERNAYNIDWIVRSEVTPDEELHEGDSLVKLRERARQLVKDNPIIAGLQQMYINLVGTPSAVRIKKASSKLLERQAQERLDDFNKDLTFDNLTIDEVVEQIVSCSFLEGDLLISLPMDPKREIGKQTVVELIEGNRIKTPADLQTNKDIRNGVKYDSAGHVLGYYVKKYDKIGAYGDQLSNYDFFPRIKNGRVVTQLFKAPLNSRPKMSRQYPIITPIIPLIKHMDDYLEAVIVGARVAACFAGFITTNNPAKAMASMTTEGGGVITDPRDSYSSRRVTKLKPGMLSYLKPNEDISFASPNRPNDNVDAFLVRLQRLISMYIRVPYEIAFLDLSITNYSSWRGGDNEVKKLKLRWRKRLDYFISWIENTVLQEASLFEVIRVGESRLSIRWPSFSSIDTLKENRANAIDIENGTTTPQRIIEERGDSFEEIQTELTEYALLEIERKARVLKRQKELEEQYGIKFPETNSEKESGDAKKITNADGNEDGE